MKELDEKLEVWKNCTAQVKLLVGGISKSSQNLTTHLSNAARQVQREADKKRKQAETKEVAEAKKKAKAVVILPYPVIISVFFLDMSKS